MRTTVRCIYLYISILLLSFSFVQATESGEFPESVISVDADYTVHRTAVINDPGTLLSWVVSKDGVTILERNAAQDRSVKFAPFTPGVYTVYLKQAINGRNRVISNVIHYRVVPFDERPKKIEKKEWQCVIYVDDSYVVSRSLVNDEFNVDIVWSVKINGKQHLLRNAGNETQFRDVLKIPGQHEISVMGREHAGGDFKAISNTVTYEVSR